MHLSEGDGKQRRGRPLRSVATPSDQQPEPKAKPRRAAAKQHDRSVEPLAYRLSDAAEAIGLSRTSIWRLIRSGKIRVVTVGGRKLVVAESLKALVA
jgi:excisionase family DNA binding protein